MNTFAIRAVEGTSNSLMRSIFIFSIINKLIIYIYIELLNYKINKNKIKKIKCVQFIDRLIECLNALQVKVFIEKTIILVKLLYDI